MDETVLEQFGFKRLSIRSQPEIKSIVAAPLPIGCCEFVGDLVFSEDGGRYCSDKTFCPKRIFADANLYTNCPTRQEKLREQKEQL
jgi:hypothetical protein